MADIQLEPSDYVHLHNHTQYSLLDGLTKVPPMIERVKELGMKAVAITDHGTMSGAIEFYKAAQADDIKPIIGMETYVARRGHQDKDPLKDKNPYHLILLAMNNHGYQNLMRLSTIANIEGHYYRPRVDHELLEQFGEGLIVLSGCIGGEIGDALRQNQYEQAKKAATWYKKVFGDRYYLEIQDHGHPEHTSMWLEQVEVTNQTLKLAKELDIECVVTCDAHYLKREDQDAHEVLLCVQTGAFLSDENRMSLKDFELHVTNPTEIIGRWGKDHPEMITNTKKIADRCDVQLDLGKILIPEFEVPKGESEKSYLRKLVYRGLAWRFGDKPRQKAAKLTETEAKKVLSKDIIERAEYELRVINDMGFNGYFLIISDFVNWGKDNGIVFGPGRGSAAGSIISYSLRITELDPIEYDLLFERFLNPDRISMPDIDIDIQDSRRDEVIQYCVNKYGSNRVANIVTFGKMAARNAVRDVARVLQVPYAEADRLAKMIPPPVQGRHILLAKSLKDDSNLAKEYEENEQARQVFDMAVQLEGTIRSHGVHAAGVVIAPYDIVKFTPLEMAQKGVIATQYSMGPIEDIGLLKMDFLGLSNLTIIKNALRIIRKVNGVDIDTAHIPLDDKSTFELFQRGDTTGVFQFESAGMKRYLKQLKPTVFDDLIAMNALYRPGPMQWIDDFIDRKHGKRSIEYLHPKTEAALSNTYGVLVYQEQVMQIAKDLCGFSGGQADTLRKGVAKKIPEVLGSLKKDFIDGALKNSDITKQKIEEFWRSLEAFAAYCFPKSHSSCYATIAYWTAYLKAHYPEAFMAALMTSDFDNTDRLAIEIGECKHMGIEVLPPDVNESFVEFAVVPKQKQIRFGMAAIKNIGTGAVEEILRSRAEAGQFKTLEEFFTTVDGRIVNKKVVESLLKSGAFDRFGDRNLLVKNLDNIVAYGAASQKQASAGQTDLFGEDQATKSFRGKLQLFEGGEDVLPSEQLQWERQLLGIYLSNHPLEQFETYLERQARQIAQVKDAMEGKSLTIGGLVNDVRVITTKNGQKMAFVQLSDTTGDIELVVFPRVYAAHPELWQKDMIIITKGKSSRRGQAGPSGELKLVVDSAKELKEDDLKAAPKTAPKKPKLPKAEEPDQKVFVRLPSSEDQEKLLAIKKVVDSHSGESDVVLVIGENGNHQAIKLPMKINRSDNALADLKKTVGAANVKVS